MYKKVRMYNFKSKFCSASDEMLENILMYRILTCMAPDKSCKNSKITNFMNFSSYFCAIIHLSLHHLVNHWTQDWTFPKHMVNLKGGCRWLKSNFSVVALYFFGIKNRTRFCFRENTTNCEQIPLYLRWNRCWYYVFHSWYVIQHEASQSLQKVHYFFIFTFQHHQSFVSWTKDIHLTQFLD